MGERGGQQPYAVRVDVCGLGEVCFEGDYYGFPLPGRMLKGKYVHINSFVRKSGGERIFTDALQQAFCLLRWINGNCISAKAELNAPNNVQKKCNILFTHSHSINSLWHRRQMQEAKHLGLRTSFLILDFYLGWTLTFLFYLAKFPQFIFIRIQKAIFYSTVSDEGTYLFPGHWAWAEHCSNCC